MSVFQHAFPRRVAILGAGMSGLAVAAALIDRGFAGDIVIYDGKPGFSNDRTWCWWTVPDVACESLCSHVWNQWTSALDGKNVVRSSSRHGYRHLKSSDYYRHHVERIHSRWPEAFLWNESVLEVQPRGDAVTVLSARGCREFDCVIDARGHRIDGSIAVQHFVGHHVIVDKPIFDSDTVTLMDMLPSSEDAALNFMYVLPFSSREALVEDTVITTGGISNEARRFGIRRYLAGRGVEVFDIIREETGCIPMGAVGAPSAASPRLLRAGAAAGATRASSGYTFVRAQRHAAALAKHLCGEAAEAPGFLRFYMSLDAMLLEFMRRRLLRLDRFFFTLQRGLSAGAFARFMSDAARPDDLPAIATAAINAFRVAAIVPRNHGIRQAMHA